LAKKTVTIAPAVLTREQLAQLLDRSMASTYRDEELGRIPAGFYLGGNTRCKRWLRSDIDSWLANGCPAVTKTR
jgi:predicted DNA-binding transcriptional regulator AlpA